ncbi:hypothetical protein [Kineosporia babensis]|uniref:Uncharacterized protein n=1 Tax=Kineosporia babensis TaxID=499548 RepID=A0A9X1SW61_9ACTN|nr:hypothetical protein [Kineosporia babensis]MCD5314394.1 hypothetical protein [Kineosporia babensis]
MSPSTARATGFAISVPDGWLEVDLHPDSRNASINDLVTRQVKEVPELREHRAALVRALRSAARSAHAAGAAYTASMIQPIEDAVIAANVTISIVEAPNEENASETIVAHLAEIPRGAGEDPVWREVTSTELPGIGRVPRTQGVEDITMPEGSGWIRSVIMQTFVPVPGSAGKVALVTCSSPILALSTELIDLFDAVTSTFRFLEN